MFGDVALTARNKVGVKSRVTALLHHTVHHNLAALAVKRGAALLVLTTQTTLELCYKYPLQN